MQQHFAARLRAAGFDEAQVPCGDFRFEREVELCHAPALAPLAQQRSRFSRWSHGATIVQVGPWLHYLGRNRRRLMMRGVCAGFLFTINHWRTAMNAIAASIDRSSFLRRVLFVDAATCAVMGLLLAFDAGALSPLLRLPTALLEYAGLSLFPVAGYIAWVATR